MNVVKDHVSVQCRQHRMSLLSNMRRLRLRLMGVVILLVSLGGPACRKTLEDKCKKASENYQRLMIREKIGTSEHHLEKGNRYQRLLQQTEDERQDIYRTCLRRGPDFADCLIQAELDVDVQQCLTEP